MFSFGGCADKLNCSMSQSSKNRVAKQRTSKAALQKASVNRLAGKTSQTSLSQSRTRKKAPTKGLAQRPLKQVVKHQEYLYPPLNETLKVTARPKSTQGFLTQDFRTVPSIQ